MPSPKILLVDALINLLLGVLLLSFPSSVVDWLGMPQSDTRFYPSILGAVLVGIAVALLIEYRHKPGGPVGLGLGGAIAINLCGALVVAKWLLSGKLDVPLRGRVILGALAAGLIVISLLEVLLAHRATTRD